MAKESTAKRWNRISVLIPPDEEPVLLQKIAEAECLAKTGANAGKPSVNTLLRKIASGEVQLIRR